jgi:hypothetical protein
MEIDQLNQNLSKKNLDRIYMIAFNDTGHVKNEDITVKQRRGINERSSHRTFFTDRLVLLNARKALLEADMVVEDTAKDDRVVEDTAKDDKVEDERLVATAERPGRFSRMISMFGSKKRVGVVQKNGVNLENSANLENGVDVLVIKEDKIIDRLYTILYIKLYTILCLNLMAYNLMA